MSERRALTHRIMAGNLPYKEGLTVCSRLGCTANQQVGDLLPAAQPGPQRMSSAGDLRQRVHDHWRSTPRRWDLVALALAAPEQDGP